MHSESSYLPAGLPVPVAEPDGLSAPYWGGLQQGRLLAGPDFAAALDAIEAKRVPTY